MKPGQQWYIPYGASELSTSGGWCRVLVIGFDDGLVLCKHPDGHVTLALPAELRLEPVDDRPLLLRAPAMEFHDSGA